MCAWDQALMMQQNRWSADGPGTNLCGPLTSDNDAAERLHADGRHRRSSTPRRRCCHGVTPEPADHSDEDVSGMVGGLDELGGAYDTLDEVIELLHPEVDRLDRQLTGPNVSARGGEELELP